MAPLFDLYIAADYSGAGEHDARQRTIAAYRAVGAFGLKRLYPPGGRIFSRDSLREAVLDQLDRADKTGRRVLFGFDHQFSWPLHLWEKAGLASDDWRTAVRKLAAGDGDRPPLDIPRRFCRAFNEFAREGVFRAAIADKAGRYGIPHRGPSIPEGRRFRLTELRLRALGFSPKPADVVGGQGEGVVGGQTICGLHHIARMLDRESLSWWPYDGPDIADRRYEGRHVGVEIYPAMFVPPFVRKSDENDARYTCWGLQAADRMGWLKQWMNLGALSDKNKASVLKEGWILGVTHGDKDG